jgi:uncharacterized flavoprotein (TIGR03862 family)
VVGGGPAGLMAAETMASHGWAVTVFEQRRSVGRKFLLAGRSGLNLTHSEPLERLIGRYETGSCAPLIAAAVDNFPPDAVSVWSSGLGEPTTVGTSGRVFPASWRATPLLRAWRQRLMDGGVSFTYGCTWLGWESWGESGKPSVRISGPDGVVFVANADAVVMALGGTSWPSTGSDGGWRAEFDRLGIERVEFRPSNAGLRVSWSDVFCHRFEGVAIKHVAVSLGLDVGLDRDVGLDGKRFQGDLVVTRAGLQGTPAYMVSARITSPVVLTVDLLPDQSLEALSMKMSRARAADSLTTKLRKVGLSNVAVGLAMEFGVRNVSPNPAVLASFIKAVPVAIDGTEGVERAISVAGGVMASAINERFMLRSYPGVFLAGEMLDWDAPTGGYLLQGCLASGVAAANGALAWWISTEESA